ncbi:ATP-dependent RNA helicase HrpA [Desulfobacula toluolica]|uniref:RNA helicase n=1 Tax=Desulfobacula toluolica (strain DSM 7467 / Tol2) TaxID=651182 RepID=K0NS39_DESTT|nr:ATP-dependent RNA helicase HrpA [Desulfobacula toluolica]CCK81797.1 HrpA: ATP-dependent RNA helicase [Desulfobacula toluolica Tol2]
MKKLKKIESLCSNVMLKDKHAVLKELRAIKKLKPNSPCSLEIHAKKTKLLFEKTQRSAQQTRSRLSNKPSHIVFNPDLPITHKKDDIICAIKNNSVVIISGETGSGKTTQIPKFCLEAGRGIKGLIGCTQPRRIAAVNVARRIAEELNENIGKSVGYKIRFDDKTNANAYIKMMTDGILLAETQADRFLSAYDTIIVDEAHERSLNIDFTLGILRRLVRQRKDLKLIITSATIDTQKFSKAFDNAPIIEVSGRMYPVETLYRPFLDEDSEKHSFEDQGYVEAAADAVHLLLSQSRSGDILVFMPTEQDIGETMELIRGKQHPGVTVLPLFARLSAQEQSKIFSRQVGRKVIVSTNVAETSLTIPGIKYVVDTGLARIPSYSPRTRTTSLPVSPISQSSANQRLGRCGRVENGICIRLFDEDDFGARPFFTSPEILRSNLAEVILRMIALNLGDVSTFPFIDAPAPKSVKDGFDTLIELGAIKEKTTKHKTAKKKEYTLTKIGLIMAKLPIDPKLSRILIEADTKGCLAEAVIITTALAISDPRQRPAEKTQAADQQHAMFKDPGSDFITILNIWNAVKAAEKKLNSRSKLKKFCQDHFLSFKRLREWTDIHGQIVRILKEHGIRGEKKIDFQTGTQGMKSKEFNLGGPLYIALHQSLLSGYLANIAHKKEKNIFSAAKGQQAMIFPGSGLFNTAGNWIVAAEFVKTSQLFARSVATIDPEWLEPIAKDLCAHTYCDPHWEKKRGQVIAKEQVSLFGLIIVDGRNIAYGKINPEESGEIFIRHALVQGEIHQQFEFMTHNRQLIDQLETLEHKTRRKDILASEDDMYLFYQSRLPKHFYNIRTFSKFIKDQKNQDFLKMTLEDLQQSFVDETELCLFPDALTMEQGKFKLEYEFNPGSQKDGVTLKVPAASAAMVSKNSVDRLIPGLFENKIAALIKALPKKYRVKLVPVSEKAAIIAKEMPEQDKPLYSQLSSFIQKRFDLVIPATLWSDKELPDHLKMRISIRDKKGKEIKAIRDKSVLNEFYSNLAPQKGNSFHAAQKKYELSPVKEWNFKDLEDVIIIDQNPDFMQKAYPGLQIETKTGTKNDTIVLSLRLFKSEQAAQTAHCKGINALFQLCFPDDFKALKKDINISSQIKQMAPFFNGQTKFQQSLFNLITTTVFAKNIRTKKEFETHAQKQLKLLYHTGRQFIKIISTLGKEYQACFELIQKLSFQHQKKKKTFDILTALFKDLKNIVPENFLDLYTMERIEDLHRYVACIRIRAQKSVDNPLKEEKKALQTAGYTKHLNQLLSSLSQDSSTEKSQQVEDFFWLIEEYKISLFAQELKTKVKISAKKLDQFLIRLSTMI